MSVQFDQQLSILFNALGDTTRLLILEELRKRHDQTLFDFVPVCSKNIQSQFQDKV